MFDVLGMVARLNRPTLLVQAARFGMDGYKRADHLPRLLKTAAAPRSGEALVKLLEIEKELDDSRKADRAEYLFAHHIEVLSAIMAETRTLRAGAAPRAV